MKRKIWTLSPWFIIFLVIMLGMSLVSYRFDPYLCYVELGITLISALIVFFSSVRFKLYLKRAIKSTIGSIEYGDSKYLEKYKMPMAVVGKKGDIIWNNTNFSKCLCNGRNP